MKRCAARPGKGKLFRGLAGSFDSIAICASADARERKLPMTDMLRPSLGIATVPCGTSWLRAGATVRSVRFRCSAVILWAATVARRNKRADFRCSAGAVRIGIAAGDETGAGSAEGSTGTGGAGWRAG